MSDRNLEEEYIRDKKYIHETLEGTKKHMEKIHENFEAFKTDVSKSIAVIQTKLALYVAFGSLFTGGVVQLVVHAMKG